MCGITGTYQPGGRVDLFELDAFTDALEHRGPDGRGVWSDGDIGLGHRRLAILDLSPAGTCPMHYQAPNGETFVITFNGEVYNFIELKNELKQLGYVFKSDTDTEVVVAAFAAWGVECLQKLNGMFAIAIWDKTKRTLFLARDRFGIKPLYFQISNRLTFASELKAFCKLNDFSSRIDWDAAQLSISNHGAYEGASENTLLAGVRRLLPGTHLTLDAQGNCKAERWWETVKELPILTGSYDDHVVAFRELFLDSIALRMRSDVPIGTCLSGGVDSSAVTSAMAWLQNQRGHIERSPANTRHAFISTFPGTALDEKQYADIVVDDTGITPHYWEFSSDLALKNLMDSLWSMEEVYNGIAVPVWSTYREVRRHGVTVTLDGHGADELLCGYPWTLDWSMGAVNANLYNDFHVNILPAILRNFDRCSMAHGVEIRTPFLDYRLVTFCFALAAEEKVGAGYTKRILRDATKGILHDSVRLRRQKIGFNSPMIEWFNGGMAPFIRKVVQHPLWMDCPLFDGSAEARWILRKTEARAWGLDDWDQSLQAWIKMNLVLWQLLFLEGEDLSGMKRVPEAPLL